MTQPRRMLWLAVIAATLCLLGVPAALRAQDVDVIDDGHEVVITSFPDGANVWIDNIDTGKVAPWNFAASVRDITQSRSLLLPRAGTQTRAPSMFWTLIP